MSVAIENSLSRQGILASYFDSERDVATGVGHDKVGQAKPSVHDCAHSRRLALAATRAIGELRASDQGSVHRQERQGTVVTERLCRDGPIMLLCRNKVDQ